jgi:hypothetical protein
MPPFSWKKEPPQNPGRFRQSSEPSTWASSRASSAPGRLQGFDPYEYLVDVLQRVGTHPAKDVDQLTPRLWKEHFADNPLRSDLYRIRGHH